VFLRSSPRAAVDVQDRRLAPALAIAVAALVLVVIAGYWTVYRIVAA
jgi:hypothetical protein